MTWEYLTHHCRPPSEYEITRSIDVGSVYKCDKCKRVYLLVALTRMDYHTFLVPEYIELTSLADFASKRLNNEISSGTYEHACKYFNRRWWRRK